jgi:general secretion pathway protein K
VSVLWGISILSLIAASMMSTGTLSVAIERNALKRAQADRIAESAIVLGVLGLLDPRPDKRWRVDGVAQEVTFAEIPITISIQDEFGLIDLNYAGEELFRDLFRSAGVEEREALRLAERVVDWRTTAATRVARGRSSVDDYRIADYAPRGAPFQSVDEIKLVFGVTASVFARIEPALTVYSQLPTIDPRIAPREALLALPGMDSRQVDSIIALRPLDAGNISDTGLPLGAGVIDPTLALNGHAFRIRAAFRYRGSAAVKSATIQITNNPTQPYLVFDW